MFTSSMKMQVDLPGFAPSNAFFIFSNFPSMVIYVTYEVVYAEKIR